ncbi:hypothetical protein [Halococcus sp. IIIV-5B]|uniref:DUF7692 domain-containing protein n=1 Tax=Halococcus sp. IIIV-5B TaxID=2321230 RepID=UPI000E74328F|nr:hypothetical protein [Halococcus sp. IIIV-5B]RJS96768.1 hypothetical protein D3261_18825 [Halococcus sp. IIIV-5B]
MRIKTDGKHEYRVDQLRQIMQAAGEGTKSGAFDFSTEFTLRMLENLEQAINHPDMTEGLAEVLSTSTVELSYRIETDLDVNPSRRARADK